MQSIAMTRVSPSIIPLSSKNGPKTTHDDLKGLARFDLNARMATDLLRYFFYNERLGAVENRCYCQK